jgi:hypothetical protein
LLILILPWLVTIALGGFSESSVVIVWAALCPLGSLLLEELGGACEKLTVSDGRSQITLCTATPTT